MNKNKLLTVLIICSLFFFVFFFYVDYASTSECPSNLNDRQCLEYLQRKSAELQQQRKELTQSLSQERYNQMTLAQQIEYMKAKISESEIEIQKIELDLETKNVEIRILQRDIEDAQNNISTISQETNKLENSINKRTTISYKNSFLSPLELILSTQNLDELFRKIKYLNESRKSERELLEYLVEQNDSLDKEKTSLEKKQLDVETKRIEVEEKKSELFKEKQTLANQQATHSSLLAQSRNREETMLRNLESNNKLQSSIDAAIIDWIARNSHLAVDSGPVPAGAIIGRMGNTGLSTGPHLHFSIGTWNSSVGSGNISPWNGYFIKQDKWYLNGVPLIYNGYQLYYISAGTMPLPLGGRVRTHQDHHQGFSIDLYSLYGAGTPVYAVMEGTLYRGVDQYGGKYAYIMHPNNLKTTYLHLQ